MIDFTSNGKRYIAGQGFMQVFDAVTGNKVAGFIDVFREIDPTPELCISLYSEMQAIAERLENQNLSP